MRRIGRATLVFAMACLAIGSTSGRSDESPLPSLQDVDPIGRILAEWQAKASKITSVDVRFRMFDDDQGWGRTRYSGHAILASPNLALFESSHVNDDGKPTGLKERVIWNGRSILQFNPDENKVLRVPIAKEWPAAPGPLRLPFLFRMTVEEARRDYDWTLVRETSDQVILIASKKAKSSPDEKTRSILFLDRKTFFPSRLIMDGAKDRGRQTYDVVAIKINAVENLDALLEPCLDAWTVEERDDWLTRLFLK
jgi:outer membrane lipoprotein-sorting protein